MDTKVKYNGKIYEIVEKAGDTIRIKNEEEEFCIHKDNVKVCTTKRKGGKG